MVAVSNIGEIILLWNSILSVLYRLKLKPIHIRMIPNCLLSSIKFGNDYQWLVIFPFVNQQSSVLLLLQY